MKIPNDVFLRLVPVLIIIAAAGLVALPAEAQHVEDQSSAGPVQRGESNWYKKTYNGGKFFKFLENHPDPKKRIKVGFENVINTPRGQRFQEWGTINDPDCKSNPAGGPDLCKDPEATGVIGIRKTLGTDGRPLYGVSCSSCHAGFDPVRPPRNVNEPRWENIHPTIGNQYLDSGKIFSANLSPTDVRRIMLAVWPKGTVDTTMLFNDNIMNPGTITAFWNVPHRPVFEVGQSEPKVRGGQGGEDDLGGDIAALRVYTNIGVCFSECVAARPGQPIDINQCKQACPDFPPDNEIADLVSFMRSTRSPKFPRGHNHEHGHDHDHDRDSKDSQNEGEPPVPRLYSAGKKVFQNNCASCHDGDHQVLSNDEVNPLIADPRNATNRCRALSSNWERGRLWSNFSSEVYKSRVEAGNRGYRTMPLAGIWATAPFLHNQSIGELAPATASAKERGLYYERAMKELLSTERVPKSNVTAVAVGPFPPGTPVVTIFSRDPVTGAVLCDDAIENHGHYYGAELPAKEKAALIHWLKYQ